MELCRFFESNKKVALAFSGGADSAYLLYMGKNCGADIRAYYVKTAFQPEFELNDAKRLAAELAVPLVVIELNILEDEQIAANSSDRCYQCKKRIFSTIKRKASEEGYEILIDGTNASDKAEDRPGMRALSELQIVSPLKICGIDKEQLRELSKAAGLFTWDKPAYSCLATRIESERQITEAELSKVEAGEELLMSMGFNDLRIRLRGDRAVVQLQNKDLPKAQKNWEKLRAELENIFLKHSIELEGREKSA